ncbi:hypothetical protein ANN_03176 [Periplaneta americana]|uniref:Mos1 transposase HTH domain-containing protein n=1 Tax=Periplaneta americana TaxID=6978 RepID=A0ABQ8TY99_PERAM|nr:hypothetical protein ANN_03176 [Periplaneta americana]
MSPVSSTESYPALVHIGLRENPEKNLNQGEIESIPASSYGVHPSALRFPRVREPSPSVLCADDPWFKSSLSFRAFTGRGGPIACPPRSSDLNPLDFYLWGHLKSLVYSSPVPDLESLRNRIVACSEDIRNTPGVWDRVRRSMRHRCEVPEASLKAPLDGLITTRSNVRCAGRDLGRIDTQHAMHVTGSVNRLRPVERSQCERKCHSAMEQRVNIKFCYNLGKTATETHGMLVQVYGREAVSRKCVYEWFKRFREGKETIEDEPRSGRPSTSRTPEIIEKVRQMPAQDRRLTLRSIAEELDISKDTVQTIVCDDLGKRKIAPDLCRTSSQTSRKQNGWKLLVISFPCVTRIHCF